MTATQKSTTFQLYFLSEEAITIEFGKEINKDAFNRVTAFNLLLQTDPFIGFITSVSAYTTLTVFFDVSKVYQSNLKGADCFEKVSNYLIGLKERAINVATAKPDQVTIPVCYGGKYGPDLESIAAHHQLTVEEVVQLHSTAVYTVYMIGFVPGFAYMGGMDERLATPRKKTPRKAIPAGAVGIAGNQTGIYPLVTPGGWQILGQTPLNSFNINRSQPSLLKAGDEVIFKSIDNEEFERLASIYHGD